MIKKRKRKKEKEGENRIFYEISEKTEQPPQFEFRERQRVK